MSLSADEVAARDKVRRWRAFIETNLQMKLKTTLDARDALRDQVAQYRELAANVRMLDEEQLAEMKTQVNLGSDFYVQAVVSDTRLVTVSVGLHFWVDMTHAEALVFCAAKETHLLSREAELTTRAADISSHIKLLLKGIGELTGMRQLGSLPKPEVTRRPQW
jgi:prefoldin subunit 5